MTPLAFCAMFVFGVMVSEHWHGRPDWQSQGGWSHDGPYESVETCEAGRRVATRVVAYDGHTVRYDAQPCRALTVQQFMRETAADRFMSRGLLVRRIEQGCAREP